MKNKISIIVPTLNQGQFIEHCIDSVLNQNYSSLQLIVIDGGSTDGTVDIIKKHEKLIDYWISEKDAGQSDAINKGLKIANGDVLNWLNSDDYLEPGSLNLLNEAFNNPGTNVFSGRSNIVRDGKTLRQSRGLDVYENNLPKTIGMARIDQPETFWRRKVIQEIGPLNINLNFIMDRDWWVRYLLLYGLNGIVNSDDILANFRLHDQSKTVSESNSFNGERNSYFANISARYGLDKIKDNIDCEHRDLNLTITKDIDTELIERSLNYFLFQLSTENYEASNWEDFKKTCALLDKSLLTNVDNKLIKKLKTRAAIMPSSVHQFLKKWR